MTEVLIAVPKIKINDKTFVKKSVKHYDVNQISGKDFCLCIRNKITPETNISSFFERFSKPEK